MKYRSDFIVVQNFLCISDTRPEDTPARKYSNKFGLLFTYSYLCGILLSFYMLMKKSLLTTLSLLVCVLAMAEPISSKKALEIATSYLAKSGAPRRVATQMSVQPFQTDRQGNPLMYAVNNGGDGYVIVSGDDRMRQVLAYSDSGKLDIADMPENMRYWLQCLAADMQLLIDAGYQPQAEESRRAAAAVKTEVTPMLSCQWGQNAPYNDICPTDEEGKTLTGCVATAMAQVLYYHKKERQAEIPSKPLQDTEAYTGNRGVPVPALKAENYAIDWNQLVKEYSETSTDAQKQNIAKLMLFCGAAVYMDYNSSVSLASSIEIAPALIKYFGFSPKTRIVERSSYTEQQWVDLMYNELKSGRPVLYGGSGTDGGHQFVLDGYDGNEMFHFNWGWDGRYDGFVALSVLNSGEKFPVGARESTAEFASDQSAIINAEYGGTGTPSYRLSYYSSRIEGNEIYFGLINNTGVINSFEVCLAYKNQKTGAAGYYEENKETWNDLKKGYYRTHGISFTTPYPALANNDIIVWPVSRLVGATEWQKASDEVLEYGVVSYDAEGNLTLSLYPKEKLNTTISVEGNKYAGSTQKIKAAVTNTGDEQQFSIYLWVKTDPDYFDNTEEKDRKYEAYAGITALKNATHVEVIPFTPAAVGTYYIWVTKDRTGKEVLAKEQVSISANPHTVNGLAFNVFEPQGLQTTTIQTTGEIVQEVYAASITPVAFSLVNASATDITDATVTFKVWKKEGETWTEKPSSSITGPVSIKAGYKINVNGWTFVNGIGEYRIDLLCNENVSDTRFVNTYETYIVADEYGKLIPTKYTSGTIVTPANATALVLDNIVSKNVAVTANENPNTLYYLGAGMTATGLEGKNIINSDDQLVATSIVLQDGYNFCPAYNFTAESISYKRSLEAGWTTLMLPFEITTIPEGLTAYEFVSEDGDEVTFKQLSKLSAFEACLLRVDAAKEYTFTATNQKVSSGYLDAATAKNFKFIGISSKPDYAKAYMLSADGSKFELSSTPAYQSFRGCFVPTYGASYLPEVLTIKGIPTGIKTIKASDAKTDGVYYNLSGQRVGADYKGIVIHNGKKIIKK